MANIKIMPFFVSGFAMVILGIIFRVAGELTPFGSFVETLGPESMGKLVLATILFVFITVITYPFMKDPEPKLLVKWATALASLAIVVWLIAEVFYYLIYTGVIAA